MKREIRQFARLDPQIFKCLCLRINLLVEELPFYVVRRRL